MSTSTAPHRRPAARPPAEARPRLAVVPEPRRPRVARVAALAGVVLLVALLGSAVAHTHLVSGQRDLDHLDTEIRATERTNVALRLRVAELESPARIVAEARRQGMIVPEEVTWVSPDPDGASQVVPRSGATEPEVGDGTDTDTDSTDTDPSDELDAPTDARAAADPTTTDEDGTSR